MFLASYATEERTTDDSREGLPPEIHALGERAAGCAHIGRELCDRPPGRDASALPIRLVASFRRPRPSLVAWLPGSLWIAGKHQFGVSIYSHSMRQATMRLGAGGGNRSLMGPSGGQFEPRLFISVRGHGGSRMGRAVVQNSMVERTWVRTRNISRRSSGTSGSSSRLTRTGCTILLRVPKGLRQSFGSPGLVLLGDLGVDHCP